MIDFTAPYTLMIGGQSVGAAAQLDVVNPATGQVFAHCPAAGATELDDAVAAARPPPRRHDTPFQPGRL